MIIKFYANNKIYKKLKNLIFITMIGLYIDFFLPNFIGFCKHRDYKYIFNLSFRNE